MSEDVKKLYYGIKEVSEITGIKQYVLRYWESEFDLLRPLKNRSGNRVYTEDDILSIKKIQRLLHVEKYTIEGAKLKMATDTAQSTPRESHQGTINSIRIDLMDALKKTEE